MIRSLWTASTGMNAQMTYLDVISNNLANINTTGFKKSKAEFQDLIYETIETAGTSTGDTTTDPTGQQVGLGTALAATKKQFSQGSLERTDRELDLAIDGKGFFVLKDDQGKDVYTRNGSFNLDTNGALVNSDGLKLIDATIPSTARSISVGQTGKVSYVDNTGAATEIGTIQLAMFNNPAGLIAKGQSIYQASDASGTATLSSPGASGAGKLQQFFLEKSNVNLIEEMVSMITTQRAYEINSKSIKSADQMIKTATTISA